MAEGTIFRAFPTKEALEAEAVHAAFCPAELRRQILGIDPALPIRDRLVAFARLTQRRFSDVFDLMRALGLTEPPAHGQHDACYPAGCHVPDATTPAASRRARADRHVRLLLLDVADGLVPDAERQLALPADQVLHRIRLLTFSGSHPGISGGLVLTPEEIVDTILDGVRRRPAPDAVTH